MSFNVFFLDIQPFNFPQKLFMFLNQKPICLSWFDYSDLNCTIVRGSQIAKNQPNRKCLGIATIVAPRQRMPQQLIKILKFAFAISIRNCSRTDRHQTSEFIICFSIINPILKFNVGSLFWRGPNHHSFSEKKSGFWPNAA